MSGTGRVAHRRGRGARTRRPPRPPRGLAAARRDSRRFGLLLAVFFIGFLVCTVNAYTGVKPTPLWLAGFFVYMALALYALGQWLSAQRAVTAAQAPREATGEPAVEAARAGHDGQDSSGS